MGRQASDLSSGRILVRGELELHYEICGEGETVLLIAGLADDHTSWHQQVEALAQTRRIVTFDNRGCGLSSVPPGPYSTREMATDTHELIARLELGPVDVVGSSMGGAIAQWLAIDHPADVRKLVISNSWGRREPYLEWLFDFWIQLAAEPVRLVEAGRLASFSSEFMRANRDRVIELTSGGAPDPGGFKAAAIACREHDASERIGEIRHRTLVLAARHDFVTPPRLASELAEQLPNAELLSLDSGHMICWERAAELNAILNDFLS